MRILCWGLMCCVWLNVVAAQVVEPTKTPNFFHRRGGFFSPLELMRLVTIEQNRFVNITQETKIACEDIETILKNKMVAIQLRQGCLPESFVETEFTTFPGSAHEMGVKKIRYLLPRVQNKNVFIDAKGHEKLLLRHHAITSRPEVVIELLKQGTDPNFATKGEFLPLQGAVIEKKLKLIEILLEHGADMNKKNVPPMCDWSALQYADQFNDQEITAIFERYKNKQ